MHVMLDFETLGTKPNAVIASIGAVAFDKDEIKEEFYTTVDIHSACNLGMTMDSHTVQWWIKQAAKDSKSADLYQKDGSDIKTAITAFSNWCKFVGAETIWGNGADFDNVILKSACDATDVTYPIKYYNNRCFRTMRTSFPKIEIIRQGTHHNALDDAIYQATYLIELMRKHNFG